MSFFYPGSFSGTTMFGASNGSGGDTPPAEPTPSFIDDFTGSSLDSSKWLPYLWWGGTNNGAATGEVQEYVPEANTQSGGILSITATQTLGATTNTGALTVGSVSGDRQVDAGSVAITNPGNITASDTSYAVVTRSTTGTSDYFDCTNFGFDIPSGARILGVKVEIRCKQDTASIFQIQNLKINYWGYEVSDDMALPYGSVAIPTAEGYITFGGATSLFNSDLTGSQISDAAGFGISFNLNKVSGSTSKSASINHVRMTVYYQDASYTSGIINSYNSFSQQYGRFEIRMKVPAGVGLAPMLMLFTQDNSWPPEVDAFRVPGSYTSQLQYNVFYGTESNVGNVQGYLDTVDLSEDYHTYTLDWRANAMTWFIDGVQVDQITDPDVIPNKPMYLQLCMPIGGPNYGNVDGTVTFPRSLLVDYIKVFP